MNRINNQQKWEFLCPTYFTEDKGELVKLFILSDTKHLICKLIMRRKAANDVVQEAGSFPWLTEMKKQSSKVSEVTLDAEALFIESVSLSFWLFDWKHNVTRSGWEKVDNRGVKTPVWLNRCVVCPVSELCVPVPWGEIRGKVWGPDHGRPVLCVHGWADNCGTFNNLIPLLPKGNCFVVTWGSHVKLNRTQVLAPHTLFYPKPAIDKLKCDVAHF